MFSARGVARVEEQVERGVHGRQAVRTRSDALFAKDAFGAHKALGYAFHRKQEGSGDLCDAGAADGLQNQGDVAFAQENELQRVIDR